ncbi:MAG: ABC-F family ATP-binding cassette domain-containing protein [Arcobacteraceae bacterium]|jgi:ATP-binding cassette subfamily F protein uup|nr:ABC-F family ATP-binding cassette domain-containing protein [Arcobacteraceae bacterium]
MAIIDIQKISKQYDIKVILKDVDFTLEVGQRVAVIGQNGQGKSTFMKILTGETEADSGEIAVDKSVKIEMLEQQPKFKAGTTVREAIEEQLVELKSAQREYDALSLLIAEDYENEELLQRQSTLSIFLDHHNAWDLDNKIQRVLQEFMLKEYEFKDVSLLSGGEQRRVGLAGLILKKPDVLLLDEPTNHLDVYMVEFLEEILLKEKFTLIFISHDRYFLDNIATNIVEIENGTMTKFKGGYKDYLLQKEQMLLNMQRDHENLVRKLRDEAWWMQHGVTARRKRNELRKDNYFKLKEDVKKNPGKITRMKLELDREKKAFNGSEVVNKKKMLFELDNAYLTLGDKPLIKDFTTRILQKDTIAIVGPNGSGKSTMLKVFLERLKIDKGSFKKGDFKIGYFDQHREMLDENQTIMHQFCPNGGDRVELNDGRSMHVFGYLKNFLFPKEYLDKKVGVLSGGEKNRIALALLFTKKFDVLIMDEPTNDLDIPTINILEEYLQSFQGALIFVSHDRYFVDKIAKKLFIFKGDGLLEESFQKYSEYLEDEKDVRYVELMEKEELLNQKKPAFVQPIVEAPKKKIKLTYQQQKDYENLPDEIEKLELEIKKINECLSNPKCYEEKGIVAISKELENITKTYDEKVERYLEIEELIIEITQ